MWPEDRLFVGGGRGIAELQRFAGRARPLMQTMESRILIAAKFNTVPLMGVDGS